MESEFDVAVVIIVRNEASKNFNSIVQGKIVTPLVSRMKNVVMRCRCEDGTFLNYPLPSPIHCSLNT